MLMKTLVMIAVICSALFLFRVVFSSFKSYEEPFYQVQQGWGHIQIRHYQAHHLVSTDISGNKEYALRQGFKRLAAYIFGGNAKQQYISMTAPVMLESHAMNWRVSFLLPRAYALDSLPKPNDTVVFLHHQEPGHYAVIKFSGRARLKNFMEKRRVLEHFLTKNNCLDQGRVVYAFYNPPWTLPFLRRNEVWIELGKSCQHLNVSKSKKP